jgi:hypothetical protein
MIINGDLPVPIGVFPLLEIVQGSGDVDNELFGQFRRLI